MQNKLYELILDHGNDIFPYLEILAKHNKDGIKHEVVIEIEKYDARTLDSLANIDLIRYVVSGSTYVITVSEGDIFNDDFRFFCMPKKSKVKQKIQSRRRTGDDEMPQEICDVVSKAGYPSDWVRNPNKYKTLYYNSCRIFGKKTIKDFAEYLSEIDDKDARSLFTKSYIESFKSGKLTKKDRKSNGFIQTRQETNYKQEDF